MTPGAVAAAAVAAVAAVVDWFAVARRAKRVEYVAKPLAMAALVGVAVAVDPTFPERRAWFVAAGVLALAGDVFLMLPRDRFVAGLVSFLAAHVLYVVGFTQSPASRPAALAAALLYAVVAATVGRAIVRGVRARHPGLVAPVLAYMVAIGALAVAAFAVGPPLAGVGAVLFVVSDGILAWRRFVAPQPWAAVAVMVTYHLGQAGLILSLVA